MAFEIANQPIAEMTISLLFRIEGQVASEQVERLLTNPKLTAVADRAHDPRTCEAIDDLREGRVHSIGGRDLVADELILDFQPDIIIPTPSYLLVILDEFRRRGLDLADMLRKAMSSSMRWRSGEICLVIGVLPLKRSAHAAPTTITARLRRSSVADGQSHVAKVILCDM